MVRERHNVAFLVGVIFGAAGAAIAALLYTPLSGAETRQQLTARAAALRGGDSTPEPRSVQGGETTVTTTRIFSSDAAEATRTQDDDTTVKTTRTFGS